MLKSYVRLLLCAKDKREREIINSHLIRSSKTTTFVFLLTKSMRPSNLLELIDHIHNIGQDSEAEIELLPSTSEIVVLLS